MTKPILIIDIKVIPEEFDIDLFTKLWKESQICFWDSSLVPLGVDPSVLRPVVLNEEGLEYKVVDLNETE